MADHDDGVLVGAGIRNCRYVLLAYLLDSQPNLRGCHYLYQRKQHGILISAVPKGWPEANQNRGGVISGTAMELSCSSAAFYESR